MYGLHPITITASTTLDRDIHAFNTVNLNALAGLTVTLPASSGNGDVYEIFVPVTVTSNNYIIQVANGTDVINGVVHLATDIAGTSMPATGTDDTIHMNGSTKGGVKGTWIRLKDAYSGVWALEGSLVCTGTEATPFSAAVS